MSDRENNRPASDTDKQNRETETILENIERSASVAVKGDEVSIYCLSIIGQVEGHYIAPEGQKATKYEQIIPLLVSVEENPTNMS